MSPKLRGANAQPSGIDYGTDNMPRVNANWDAGMRAINDWGDRQDKAWTVNPPAARLAALKELDAEVHRLTRGIPDPWREPSPTPPRGWFGRFVKPKSQWDPWARRFAKDSGTACLSAQGLLGHKLCVLECATEMEFQLTRLALALAACKAQHGQYPEALDALVPEYLKEVPRDLFVDQPLKYRRQGEGYLLYSVGPNTKDDGGAKDNTKDGPDDIAVEAK